MKFSLAVLLGLLCTQGLLGASLVSSNKESWEHKEVDELIVEDSNDKVALTPFGLDDVSEQKFPNPLTCIPAITELGRLGVETWQLVKTRNEILKRANEERERCNKLTAPEEQKRKCRKNADDAEKNEMSNLNASVWKLVANLGTAIVALIKCLI